MPSNFTYAFEIAVWRQMPKLLLAVTLMHFSAPSISTAQPAPMPEVVLTEGGEREVQAKAQLIRLWSRFDLSPWLFTDKVRVKAGSIPHSHPILTLNTRHLDDDLAQLSTFLHEQIHWFLESRVCQAMLANILDELRERYPDVPPYKATGTRSDESSYLHIIVNWLEFDGLRQLLGEDQARKLIRSKDHYEWLYKRVLEEDREIEALLASEGILIDAGQ